MEDEDATLLAEARRQDDAPFRSPIWLTDGIRLSDRFLAEIASNPSKYLNRPSRHGEDKKQS